VARSTGTMGRCVCGKPIRMVSGEWHHWWSETDKSTGKRVICGIRYCRWVGEPSTMLLVATPREGSAAAKGQSLG
jgi:hypothetical protein